LRASFDALSPDLGLGEVSFGGTPLAGSRFLGIELEVGEPAVLTEFYQRGRDLVVRYAQTDERVFAVTAYWRAGLLEAERMRHPHIDLIVSVETSLLDSRPLLAAKSFLLVAKESVLSCPPGYLLGRFDEPGVSYAEMCHPEDAIIPAVAEAGGGVKVTTWLFGRPLEKGVILRSRLRGLFALRENDHPLAEAALAEFTAEAPPLTT
jgi:hypothetical protein